MKRVGAVVLLGLLAGCTGAAPAAPRAAGPALDASYRSGTAVVDFASERGKRFVVLTTDCRAAAEGRVEVVVGETTLTHPCSDGVRTDTLVAPNFPPFGQVQVKAAEDVRWFVQVVPADN